MCPQLSPDEPVAGWPARLIGGSGPRRPPGYAGGMRSPAWLILDVCGVLAFVAIGRHTHHDGDSVAGLWHTSWPFLVGLAAGLLASRAWRQPLAIAAAGLGAWLGAAGAGMIIRVLAGQGTAFAFILVAFTFLALFLLGWRVVARILVTRLRALN